MHGGTKKESDNLVPIQYAALHYSCPFPTILFSRLLSSTDVSLLDYPEVRCCGVIVFLPFFQSFIVGERDLTIISHMDFPRVSSCMLCILHSLFYSLHYYYAN